jgi:hypothetical protein
MMQAQLASSSEMTPLYRSLEASISAVVRYINQCGARKQYARLADESSGVSPR